MLGRTKDAMLGRRTSWTGAVIKDMHRTDDRRGHYWRVTSSSRDPQTGAWEIWCDERAYLGPVPPKGETFVFDGTTWDLPMEIRRRMRRLVLQGLGWALLWYVVVGGFYALIGCQDMNLIDAVNAIVGLGIILPGWISYKHEPVITNKVAYTAMAALEARRLYRQHEERSSEYHQPFDDTNPTPWLNPQPIDRAVVSPQYVQSPSATSWRESEGYQVFLARQRELGQQ